MSIRNKLGDTLAPLTRTRGFKVFCLVFAAKLAASVTFSSQYLSGLFVPFLNRFVLSGLQNPWDFFYSLGQTKMFPYPTLMLWILTPFRLLFSPFLPSDWLSVTPTHWLALRIPLLLFDLLLFGLLVRMFPSQKTKVLY